MSTRGLVTQMRAIAPGTWPVYYGQAGTEAVPPWIVLNASGPMVSERAMSSQVHTSSVDLLVTAAALTEDQALTMVDAVQAAYEGALVTAAGWTPARMLQDGGVPIFPQEVTITGTNRRLIVAKVRFCAYVTRTP